MTSASAWNTERRPEIVEDFEREVIGRIPHAVPKVSWSETGREEWTAGQQPVVGRRLVGHVDNSSFPSIAVDIRMTLVTPKAATGAIPVMIMFGSGLLPSAMPAGRGLPLGTAPTGPPSTEQLIADGWGYASLSVQADNGAGLTKGIIGLVNKGSIASQTTGGRCRRGPGARRAPLITSRR